MMRGKTYSPAMSVSAWNGDRRLAGVHSGSVDVCFCFDTMVHIEPRDIFNYLTQIPWLMRGKRLCVFHHANTLSELGWERFLSEWERNLMGFLMGMIAGIFQSY